MCVWRIFCMIKSLKYAGICPHVSLIGILFVSFFVVVRVYCSMWNSVWGYATRKGVKMRDPECFGECDEVGVLVCEIGVLVVVYNDPG